MVAGPRHADHRPTSCSMASAIDRPGPDRGMVFQSYTLFPWLTVADNIALRPAREGRSAGRRAARRRAVAGRASASPASRSTIPSSCPAACSSAPRSPARSPTIRAILLLDEPFGALDNQTRALMQELLLGIWERDAQDRAVRHPRHRGGDLPRLPGGGDDGAARPHQGGRRRSTLPHPRHYTIKTSPEFSGSRHG